MWHYKAAATNIFRCG